MIHQFQSNGYNIVLDVNSGSVHVVDEAAYDCIALYNEKIIEDKEKCKKRALFQAEKRINLTEQHQVESKIISNHGVLLDKLIQIDF